MLHLTKYTRAVVTLLRETILHILTVPLVISILEEIKIFLLEQSARLWIRAKAICC